MGKKNLKLVVFTLETEKTVYEYGIPIEQVWEITRPSKTIKMPGTPAFVEGIMNLRGNIIPIIDMKKRFELGTTLLQDNSRIIVIRNNEKKCGIIVDDVLEIISIAAENIDEAPTVTDGIGSQYISGVCKVDKRLIIALDMDNFLNGNNQETAKPA